MKKSEIFVCKICFILFLFLPLVAFAQETPTSFRNDATGGALFDDLDLVYDPIELHFVKGIRLYTNLANVVDSNEEILNDYSNNTLLFGVSGNIPFFSKMRASFLWQFRNATTPNPVSINSDLAGSPELYGKGDLFDNFSSFADTDMDGLFDHKNKINQEVHDNTSNQDYNVVITSSIPIANMIFAGRVNVGKFTFNNTTTDVMLGSGTFPFTGAPYTSPTFSRSILFQDLNDGFISKTLSENGDFFNEDKNSFFEVVVSGMTNITLPFGNSEARVDLKYNKTTRELNIADKYSARQDIFDREISAYEENISEFDNFRVEESNSGTNLGIALDLKHIFNPGKERRYDGFWRMRVGYDIISNDFVSSTDRRFTSCDFYFDGLDTLRTDKQYDLENFESESDIGDFRTNGITVLGLTNIPLGDRVAVGIGAQWALFSTLRDTKFNIKDTDFSGKDVLDDTSTVAYRMTTITMSSSANRKYETKVTNFRIPIGIEYTFTDSMRWRIRFGALFSYRKSITNDAKQITESYPEITRIETGDGEVTINVSENQFSSTSIHSETIRTETIFTYGIGFHPTPNLQIDLIGFLGGSESILDSDFYRKLRLSFTIRM